MSTNITLPVVYEESSGLPTFSREPDSEYQIALHKRNSWNPIISGNVAVLMSRAGRVVIGIGDAMVVKYTCFDNQEEFHALEDVGKVVTVGTPRPLLHWRCLSSGRYAVSMTRLPGEPLDDDALSFDPVILDEVSKSLRRILTSVRTLTSPTIRGPGDGMVRSGLLRCGGAKFPGVDDGVSLVEYLIKVYGPNAGDFLVSKVREYLDGLPGRKDVFVMTHSDLHPNNFVVNRTEHNTDVALIDWERSS